MKKVLFYLFIPALLTACAFSCTNMQEVEIEIGSAVTTITAYMDDESTKTGYVIDEDAHVARFNWLEGDQIDVAVVMGNSYTPVRFLAKEAGTKVPFKEAAEDGEATLESLQIANPSAQLASLAYYPSRGDAAAQDNRTLAEWELRPKGGDIEAIVTIPPVLNVNNANPLAVVPMIGTKTEGNEYAFKPATSVIAIPVKNITTDMDFISISHETAALSGSFSYSDGIVQEKALSGAGHSLTLSFSGLDGNYTFYFPVAAGDIPGGLTIRCGKSSDDEGQMILTTTNKIHLNPASIGKCAEITFQVADAKWEDYLSGSFLDDFIWGQRSWNTSTWIPVSIQRSANFPGKYRIANPYTTASSTFGYTPATAGIESDDYFIFFIDGESVSFKSIKTGVEDSAGRPLAIEYRAANAAYTHIVNTLSNGAVTEVQFAGFYTIAGNYYTKDNFEGSPKIHLKIDQPGETITETWTSVGTVQFKDDFFVGNRLGKGTDKYVDVVLEQSEQNANRYRIANPYPALCTLVGASSNYIYSSGSESPYLVMTVADDGKVTYDEFRPGIGDASRELAICHPGEWNNLTGDSKTADLSAVTGFMDNGVPYEIKLYAMYHEVGNYIKSGASGNYLYSRDTAQYGDVIVIKFPDSWNSLGNGRLWDKLVWECAGITDYVSAEFQQHAYFPSHFRIAKPYPGAESGEWFTFDVSNPEAVTSDNYFVDYEVTASGKATFKPWIRNGVDYGYNYSSVLSWQDNGLPSVVQIGPCYRGSGFDGSTEGYAYEIGRDHEQFAIEIVFPGCEPYAQQQLSAKVTHYGSPLKAEFHNPIAALDLPTGTLVSMKVKISGLTNSTITGLRLWDDYAGWIDDAYVKPDSKGVVTMTSFKSTVTAGHHLDLNMWLKSVSIGKSAHFDIQEIVMEIDGVQQALSIEQTDEPHFTGIVVNNGGDEVNVRSEVGKETVASFRIPALVTSNAGTLIAAYDVRHDHAGDLQADIDVGVKRSTDGGQTWGNLILAMDMGITGYEKQVAAGTMSWKDAQLNNGIGDPCLLVDENTGRIFCFALWTHGHYGDSDRRSLAWAQMGYDVNECGQLVMVYSDDDGLTWSAPINITRQVKKYDWRLTFQGPGRGITMKDGTLVIPIQHQEGDVKSMHGLYPLNSGIAYSTDHGLTWHAHTFAHPITSEAAVVEIEPGVLLLTMRDETDSHARRNYITTDLGRSWTEHSTNGKWLDPTCQASILGVPASKNSSGKDLVIFANPHNTVRSNMTLHVSTDKAASWTNTQVIDAGGSAYSCLTMVNSKTVGILYESSRGSIYFQAIPLSDLVK